MGVTHSKVVKKGSNPVNAEDWNAEHVITGYALEADVPTVDENADGVWNEATSDHTTTGTTGKALIDLGTSVSDIHTDVGTATTKIDTIDGIVDNILLAVIPQKQPDAVLSQNNPVSAQEYDILGTTVAPITNVDIINASCKVTWSSQCTMTMMAYVDGETEQYTFATPVSATAYVPTIGGMAADNAQSLVAASSAGSAWNVALKNMSGRSVHVTVKCANGTVSLLEGRVKYARRA
jgi:hypothetical protein